MKNKYGKNAVVDNQFNVITADSLFGWIIQEKWNQEKLMPW